MLNISITDDHKMNKLILTFVILLNFLQRRLTGCIVFYSKHKYIIKLNESLNLT